MNRWDKAYICIIIFVSIVMYIPIYMHANMYKNAEKEIVVQYKNQEILRKDMKENANYYVDGTLGTVEIEVKDGAVRVEKETSPNHLCSIQGWVKNVNQPIICLPNEIIVRIEATVDDLETLDVVIQ